MILTPKNAATMMEAANRVEILFGEGFEESSETAQLFREEIYPTDRFEESCEDALLGGEFRFELCLNNDRLMRNAVREIVAAGDWTHIYIRDNGNYVVIRNERFSSHSEGVNASQAVSTGEAPKPTKLRINFFTPEKEAELRKRGRNAERIAKQVREMIRVCRGIDHFQHLGDVSYDESSVFVELAGHITLKDLQVIEPVIGMYGGDVGEIAVELGGDYLPYQDVLL